MTGHGANNAPHVEDLPLCVSELGVRFGRRDVLSGVSLMVAPGRSLAVVGRSGVGKSTLLNAVLGLVKVSAGSVSVAGRAMTGVGRDQRAKIRRECIGTVFQHGELFPQLSPLENVMLPALLVGADRVEAEARGRKLLEQMEIPPDNLASNRLSGGERQRTALARALICQPALLLADEPTGSLDTETKGSVAELLFDSPRIWGSGLLVVTHDASVARLADDVVRIDDGGLTWR